MGTFVKLLPSVRVISRVAEHKTSWRDFAGWTLSLISSLYFVQEPSIYRNDKVTSDSNDSIE